MSIKILMRQGDSADPADDADITDDAPIFDETQSLISLGGQWEDGESGTGDLIVEDYDGTSFVAGSGKVLGSGCLLTATEDASGCAYWWFRGRKFGHSQGRGARKGGNASEWQVHTQDPNIELTDLYLTEDWPRGAETGYQRLVALQLYMLNGVLSTAPHHRDTTLITVADSHLAPNSNSQTLPAKTYTIGMSAREIVEDCALVEGKDFGVVRHHGPGGGITLLEQWTWDGTAADTYTLHAANAKDGLDHTVGGVAVTCGSGGGGAPSTGTEGTNCYVHVQVGGVLPTAAWLKAAPGDVFGLHGWSFPYAELSCEIRIRWVDAANTEIGSEPIGPVFGPGAWTEWSGTTGAAPANTAGMAFGVCKTSDGTYKDSWFDQVSIYSGGLPATGAGIGSDVGNCSHLCLQYIVPEDITTNVSTVKISDQVADWDPDNLAAPVLEPIWNQGSATTGDPQELASAIISRWGPNQAAIFVEDTGRTSRNDLHIFVYDDADSVNATEAGIRASAILSTRTSEHYSHAPSLIMRADQIHLITEGMLVDIKSAAAIGGVHLGDYVSRRVAAVTYQPLSPELMHRLTGTLVAGYMVSLNLDRLSGKARLGRGKPQTDALTPHTATQLPYTPPSGSGSGSGNVQAQLDALEQAPTIRFLTNKSGGTVIAGDVVVVDTGNNDSFTTTTTAGETRVIGVAQATIANNASGAVALGGYVALVNVTASVTRGHYGFTSTSAKKASGASARAAGAFSQFLTSGTTPDAILFGVPDSAGAGTVTSVALTVPAEFSVSGSPVTGSGTLAVSKANESPNLVWAGPTTGAAAAPTFRALVAADIPTGLAFYRELLMQDGVTSPPEPLENEDGTDWLYSDTVSN